MNFPIKRLCLAVAIATAGATALTLSGCGGGGGAAGGSGGAVASPDTSTSSFIEGTAAIGAAFVNANISITDRSGNSVCSNDPIKTDASGAYQCKLTTSAQAPFAIVATDPDGLINPMISVLAAKPAEGQKSTANVTPITTAIAAQLDVNKDAFALVKDPSSLANVDVEKLNLIKANVVKQLLSVLQDAGVATAEFDPIATPFIGGNNTGIDKMLDQVKVTFDNGAPALSNALNPNAPAVPMADATTASPPVVAQSAITTPFSVSELDFAKTELEKCFAVPAAARGSFDGVGDIDTLDSACLGFIVNDGGSAVGSATFNNNGYLAKRYFAGLVKDVSMDGAKFNLPELMRYTVNADGKDEALLNIKWRDKNGISGNLILVAKKFAGTATPTRSSNWWLFGNQRPVDLFVRADVRKREQTIPQSFLNSTPAFNNAARSRYETGLDVYIERPGSARTPQNANLRYVRATGPGLPTAGLVYADVAAALPQTWMGILNATGTIPSDNVAQLAGVNGGTSGNIFIVQRTSGITGTAAFTLRPNPGVGSATIFSPAFAHPTMYGEAPSATWQFNLSAVPAWSAYTLELFCGLPATACGSITSRITTPLMPATFAATQQWNSLTAASLAFLADGAAAVSNVDLAWTVNPLSERVRLVTAFAFSGAVRSDSFTTSVPKGATTINLVAQPAPGAVYPAISTTNNGAGRSLVLRHTVLDGSYKDHVTSFN